MNTFNINTLPADCECGLPMLTSAAHPAGYCQAEDGCSYQVARDEQAMDDYFDIHVSCWRDNPTCVCMMDTAGIIEFTIDDVIERYGL